LVQAGLELLQAAFEVLQPSEQIGSARLTHWALLRALLRRTAGRLSLVPGSLVPGPLPWGAFERPHSARSERWHGAVRFGSTRFGRRLRGELRGEGQQGGDEQSHRYSSVLGILQGACNEHDRRIPPRTSKRP
jgi:hypothetical protein